LANSSVLNSKNANVNDLPFFSFFLFTLPRDFLILTFSISDDRDFNSSSVVFSGRFLANNVRASNSLK
jgi:hypothetical protein